MSIEILEKLSRKVTFNINKQDITNYSNDIIKKYSKTAKLKGFRPGKVPTKIVAGMYGADAYQEALEHHIRYKFNDIVTENKLALAAAPKIDLLKDEAEHMVFNAIFEVMPEVKLGNLENISITKPQCTVTEDDINEVITTLQKREASYSEAEHKVAENGDKVTVDFTGTLDGVKFEGGSATDFSFILGQGQMLPDFEAGIIGLKPGAKVTVLVSFPENYHAENLKGKQTVFEITLKKIEVATLPELTEELIRKLGISDGLMETLRQQIKNSIEHTIKERIHSKIRENVLNALQESSPLDVPDAWVHDEIHYMMDNTREQMKKQGYPEAQIKLTHDMFAGDARNMVTRRLLVQEFIKERELKVNDDETKAAVAAMAERQGYPTEEYVNWYCSDQERMKTAHAIAMEDKVINTIMSMATIKDSVISYSELIK